MKRFALACLLVSACGGPAWATGGTAPFDRAPTLFDKAMVSFYLHRYWEAGGMFDKVVAANPHDARACYYDALTHHYLGDMKKAHDLYTRIVADFPNTEYAANAHLALQRIGRASFEAPYLGDVRPTPVAAAASDSDTAGSSDNQSADKSTASADSTPANSQSTPAASTAASAPAAPGSAQPPASSPAAAAAPVSP